MPYRAQVDETIREAVLEECRRISREIHDSIAQSLSYLIIGLGELQLSVKGQAEPGLLEEKVAELTAVAQDSYARLRRYLGELRLPAVCRDPLGLCLQEACEEFARISGVPVTMQVDVVEEELEQPLKHEVLRIVQEALQNIYKHAQASRVTVECSGQGEGLKVRIADDGRGFMLEQVRQDGSKDKSLGLIIMAERARSLGGTLQISSKPSQGTTIEVLIPLGQVRRGEDEPLAGTAGR